MKQKRFFGLYPVEVASDVSGQYVQHEANVIRFYANRQVTPPHKMDTFSIEDLKANGFVPVRYKGEKDPKTWTGTVNEDPTILVHCSVPVFTAKYQINPKNEHPLVKYEVGSGWGAQWGAMHFPLRNEVELWRFMKFFEYPLPIDQK